MKVPASQFDRLDALFAPKSIAVVGASLDAAKVGGRALSILNMFGYSGDVFGVNPREKADGPVRFVPTLKDLPAPADLAVLAVSADRIAAAIRDCGEAGVRSAVVFADGFGPHSPRYSELRQALDEARQASGLRLLGPNTIGFRLVDTGVFATFAADVETGVQSGPIAMIGQSGGLSIYFGAAYPRRRGIGAKYVIDTGNEIDIDAADCLHHVAQDPDVKCVGLMLEGTRSGRKLIDAVGHAVEHDKSVIFLKTGRSGAALAQVASHTGALASSVELFETALRNAGARIANDETDFADALVVHGAGRAPKGRRIGVVTPSGGFAILALDAAEKYGMEVPEPSDAPTPEQLSDLHHGSFGNPLDYSVQMSAGPKALQTSLSWMASQPNIDAVVLWQAHSTMREDRQDLLLKVMTHFTGSKTPIFVCGLTSPQFEVRMRDIGVLWFEEPTRLIRALSVASPPQTAKLPAARSAGHVDNAATARTVSVGGAKARAILSVLPHVASIEVPTIAAAEQAQQKFQSKVFLKVEGESTAHKTEFGFVVGPLDRHEIHDGFAKIDAARVAGGADDAPIIIQPFERGVELALGAYRDPVFGPTVMVASGGIFLEILKDAAFSLAPVTLLQAKAMIEGLRGSALLQGARGKPSADIDAAAGTLVSLSNFIAEAEHVVEIDLNPLIVKERGKGASIVDALVVLSLPSDLVEQHNS